MKDTERAGRIYIMARLPESKPGEVMVIGNVRNYSFFATVQKEHPTDPAEELGNSRITTLYLKDQKLQPVYRWDRGRDIAPKNDEVRAAMGELVDQLANKLFGPVRSVKVEQSSPTQKL